MPVWVKEYKGRYRLGNFLVIREEWHVWRAWWLPLTSAGKTHSGVPGDGFSTLRDAKASIENEISKEVL